MKALDKHYLSLQFKLNIFLKHGSEFQSFFERIMEKVYLDFQKIRPLGNKGDGGNDGYRKNSGIYYQVYAPNTPKINETDAAGKLKKDFQKLQSKWSEISKIKEYYFVFNDQYNGSALPLEAAISTLKAQNPNIEFGLFLAKNLEAVFFQLNEADLLDLGFNIDQRQAILDAFSYLENVEKEFDKENLTFAKILLDGIKDIIIAIDNDALSLEHEILECRYLQKTEKIEAAKKRYEDISAKFPENSRPLLYLAEIYLNDHDFEKNYEFLEKAKRIDANSWLLSLELLLRTIYLGEKFETIKIDENTFPDDPKIKASFYRIYGLVFENIGDKITAERFINTAIHLNPDRLSSYIAQLTLLENRLLSCREAAQRQQLAQELLAGLTNVEHKFLEYGNIGSRNRADLNAKKLSVFLVQENIIEFESVCKDTFELVIDCYFNIQIDQILVRVLQYVSLPDDKLDQLLKYLIRSSKKISEDLAKCLFFQFELRNSLFTNGKRFFEQIQRHNYVEFICNLENNDEEKVLAFLDKDFLFAINLANTLKDSPILREKIIANLPDDENIQKEKLLLLLKFDENKYDEVLQILRQLDLSKLDYLECRPILQIIQQLKAWDYEIIVLKKLIEKERAKKEKFSLELQLFNAYQNIKRFQEVIVIGEQLLLDDSAENYLDPRNKEALLNNTIYACLERGKIHFEAFNKAKEILEKYQLKNPSFEFLAGITAGVYLKTNEVDKALKSIVEGVKAKKILSAQEYARLSFVISVDIGNRINLDLNSLDNVQENTFVKLSHKDQWYFIGYENELDALPISKSNPKYSLFIDKKLGDEVVFENKYGNDKQEGKIEIIFPIEKYIHWQSIQNFQRLSKDGDLEGIQVIEIPQKEDSIDLQNLLRFMEDLDKRSEPIFEMYCQNNLPLAILSATEGGLANAIGRIQKENKGFINFSSGTFEELEFQKEIAKKVVDEKLPFYIDGTSALILSETGLLQKIYSYLPNLKIPLSVINLLADITDKFRYTPGQTGHMGYTQGKITISSVDMDKRKFIQSNFIASIKLFESKPINIGIISSVNKSDCFSEKSIHDALCDACILAQKETLPVLTEDYLYLKMNETETKKKAPNYFSSLALLRILYDEKHISFMDYLDFFGYLSSYRFRFLTLNADDIEKAVFGDNDIKMVKPENIRKLNFPFTLSEEYGVPFQSAFTVVGIFLFRIIRDNTITVDVIEKIFLELVDSFPTKIPKKDLGQLLLRACATAYEKNKSKLFVLPESRVINKKLEKLSQAIDIYDSEVKILTLN
jgi:hypothetical protein